MKKKEKKRKKKKKKKREAGSIFFLALITPFAAFAPDSFTLISGKK